jgi:2-iminobutanoate/2-iminopropanoate deaminase
VTDAKEVSTDRAPAPGGPYSQAVIHRGIVYVSGQIPLDPATGRVVEGEIEAQASQVFANLRAVLEAAGSGVERVLRTSIYLTDLSLFARMNAIYEKQFTGTPKPARSTIGVARLPLGVQIEVDAIATTDTNL